MRLFVAAALVVVATIVPRSADAQFGGLMKRAAEKVKDRRTGTVSALITAESAPKLLAGLTAEASMADSIGRAALAEHADITSRVDAFLTRYAAWSTSQAVARREQQAYAECSGAPSQELMAASQSQPASQMANAMAMQKKMEAMSPAERDAFEAKMEKLQERAEVAEKSGNVAEQQRIRSEIAALTGMNMNPSASEQRASAASQQRMRTAAAKLQKCTMPKAPTVAPPEAIKVPPVVTTNGVSALSPVASREIRDSLSAQEYLLSLRTMVLGDRTVESGAAAAGISKGDYAAQRERVVYYFILPGIRGESANSGALKAGEWDALQEHRSEFLTVGTKLRRLGAI
jgi:hypothetical protein